MNRSLFLFWLFILIGFSTFAQPATKSFDAYFQKAYQDWDVPGFSIGIIKDGKVVLNGTNHMLGLILERCSLI